MYRSNNSSGQPQISPPLISNSSAGRSTFRHARCARSIFSAGFGLQPLILRKRAKHESNDSPGTRAARTSWRAPSCSRLRRRALKASCSAEARPRSYTGSSLAAPELLAELAGNAEVASARASSSATPPPHSVSSAPGVNGVKSDSSPPRVVEEPSDGTTSMAFAANCLPSSPALSKVSMCAPVEAQQLGHQPSATICGDRAAVQAQVLVRRPA
mmetsp:Transcript_4999/g.14684  ORF Transcript_4999/g.14684 Transcript_4999/m.14684 type:complete len:214 (-) Transcript_4999:12-653(-)